MDNKKLLYEISELNNLFREGTGIEGLLKKTVEMVASHTDSDVCSIYLYNTETNELVLNATHGLNPESIGYVKLKYGQGLTGLALKEMRPVCETDAAHNPNYKFFPGIHEERYDCFLAVPIARGISKIGVLTLQREKEKSFSESDITALVAAASQLADIIENARFLMAMHEPVTEREKTIDVLPEELKFVRGKIASEGFAYAPSIVTDKKKNLTAMLHHQFDDKYTLDDFHEAINKTSSQLEKLQEKVGQKLSDSASLIFAAHLVILQDKYFIGGVEELIKNDLNPPDAILKIAKGYIESFATSNSTYMQEKIQDIEDLIVRLINNLLCESEEAVKVKGKIIITRELYPSDLLILSSEGATGIILVGGTVTSHLSILASSLRIPMIVCNNYGLLDVPDEIPVLIDAEIGNLYVDPSDEILERFEQQQKAKQTLDQQKLTMKPVTNTLDGTQVHLFANINLLADLKVACELRCEGVGLYRSEFPFMIRRNLPTETEQFMTYSKLVQLVEGRPVTLRTLDIGGDKILSYYGETKEQNPAMGLRSIRFSLQNKSVFSEQIRAMLRAGVNADLRIMFPMVSSIDEFCAARNIVHECIDELGKKNIEHNSKPKLGIMVELPCIVDLMDEFAKEAEFFSVGTNDFIQFMIGIDRTNENIAASYVPHHPSVLRALKKVVQSANKNNRPISICGDMAHEEKYIPFLLGIGVRILSMDPRFLPRIQQAISKIDIAKAESIAENMLSKSKISEVTQMLE
ncbi:MAG: phosphoenolpyruvate--protein phosphotransferase [Sedimentisphaerales bacterium]|nr:phosphoenolpyruvate--protein phosphotransferase [Sedimentisphaerales bacterium]